MSNTPRLDLKLAGKSAWVLGASGAIGSAIAGASYSGHRWAAGQICWVLLPGVQWHSTAGGTARHGRWYGTARNGTARRCVALFSQGRRRVYVHSKYSGIDRVGCGCISAASRKAFGFRPSAAFRKALLSTQWPQGVGTAASLSDALEWYRKSAAQNCAGAQPQH